MRNPPFSKQSSIWKWLNLDHEKDLSVERSGWIWGYKYAYNLWHLYVYIYTYIHLDTIISIYIYNSIINYTYTKCFILRDTKGAPFSTPKKRALTFHLFPKTRHLFDSEIAQMDRRSHPHHRMIKFCSIAIGHNLRWFPGERWKFSPGNIVFLQF